MKRSRRSKGDSGPAAVGAGSASHALARKPRPARASAAPRPSLQAGPPGRADGSGQLRSSDATRARLAAVLDSSSAAVLVMDLEGRIRVWNRGAERLYGYPAAEMVGRPFETLIPAEVPETFREFKERLLRGEPIVDHETARLDRDGNRVDVAKTMFLIRGAGDRDSEVCAIDTDIRARKRLEQKMAELLETERMRVAHELHDTLGQQVTAIGMLVASLKSVLGAGSPQAPAIAQLEETVEETKAQVRMLIRGVFPVAVEAGGLVWALRDLAQETTRLYRVSCTFESSGPAPEVEDNFTATQLFLIAREAVHNAVRHGKGGRVTIRLWEDEGIRLSVEDDGIGMPGEVDRNATMGLRIMQYRSGTIGGRMVVEPRDGGGTVVTVIRRLRRRR